ncbi:response regulator transcription factor [Sphingomonas sp. Leaf343]|uniref:response regulator transcription factor n=1 Tax=Sphingomonas sp. Leaf343 TaxID=1736345 RepID=UPI0006F71302|nr:response regulator transcription factor [Sphingomonas sp. Leaf343]KQR81365.1 two-component system response regulator [Sphingomonas sp. Leaf343]
MMTAVLLIDDDAELSRMLGTYLADEGFAVTAATTGEDGVPLALGGGFAAVILDIMLPRITGIEALRRIREESAIPVIMLTARGDDIDRIMGLELGADDYMAKPYSPRELVARLRAVLRRSTDVRHPGPLIRGKLMLTPATRGLSWAGTPFQLTVTEFKLLEALMRGGDTVATKDHLSLVALGRERQRYDRSIDVHVSNLRLKLAGVSAGAIEIETFRGFGYRLTVRE